MNPYLSTAETIAARLRGFHAAAAEMRRREIVFKDFSPAELCTPTDRAAIETIHSAGYTQLRAHTNHTYACAVMHLANRLDIMRRVADACLERFDPAERKDATEPMHQDDLFNSQDQAALDAFEAAKADLTGARPLPMEMMHA